MADFTPSKSRTTVLTHTAITHPDTLKGSAQDVSTKFGVLLTLYSALVEAVANTNPGFFSIQGSDAASGDNDWFELYRFTQDAGTPETEALTATEPVGETVLAVASTTNLTTPGQGLYIQDADNVAQSEWHMQQEFSSNVSVTILDGLKFEKAITTDLLWTRAEIFRCFIDLRPIARLRVVFIHEGAAGANCHVKAEATWHDKDVSV